jgi:hypothetical protein
MGGCIGWQQDAGPAAAAVAIVAGVTVQLSPDTGQLSGSPPCLQCPQTLSRPGNEGCETYWLRLSSCTAAPAAAGEEGLPQSHLVQQQPLDLAGQQLRTPTSSQRNLRQDHCHSCIETAAHAKQCPLGDHSDLVERCTNSTTNITHVSALMSVSIATAGSDTQTHGLREKPYLTYLGGCMAQHSAVRERFKHQLKTWVTNCRKHRDKPSGHLHTNSDSASQATCCCTGMTLLCCLLACLGMLPLYHMLLYRNPPMSGRVPVTQHSTGEPPNCTLTTYS